MAGRIGDPSSKRKSDPRGVQANRSGRDYRVGRRLQACLYCEKVFSLLPIPEMQENSARFGQSELCRLARLVIILSISECFRGGRQRCARRDTQAYRLESLEEP